MPPPEPRSGSSRSVKLSLIDLQSRETLPSRVVRLLSPDFEVRIGRGSQTEPHLNPQASNAWFSSRVMSREHAILRADPMSKQMTLEDVGSMHGTYIEGLRLNPGEHAALRSSEIVQFGAEIIRGEQTYKPLELMIEVDWDDEHPSPPIRPRPGWLMTRNSFSVDFSSEDDLEENDDIDEDDEIEVLYETIRNPNISSKGQPRTFSVPDTDSSTSECGNLQDDSAATSPADVVATKDVVSSITIDLSRDIEQAAENACAGSSVANALELSVDPEEQAVEEKYHKDKENIIPDTLQDFGNGSDSESFIPDEDSQCSDRDSDEDSEENEVESDNERLTWTEGHQPSQDSSEVYPRAPSPSDAAMPKSTLYQPPSLPTIHNLADQGPVQSAFQNCGPAPVSFAPQLPPYAYYGGPSWLNHDSTGSYHVADYDFPFNEQFQPSPTRPIVSPGVLPQGLPYLITSPQQVSLPVHKEQQASAPASKVSINDIIDEVHSNEPSLSLRKRKADEISNDGSDPVLERIPQQTSTEHEATQNPNLDKETTMDSVVDHLTSEEPSSPKPQNKMTTPIKKTVTFSPKTEIIESELPQPSSKKIKLNHHSQSSNFLKYVATAAAGVTIGAVGTVFGLAALPTDYFL